MNKIVITLVTNESYDASKEFLIKVRLLEEDKISYLRCNSLSEAVTIIETMLSQRNKYSLNLKWVIYSQDKQMHLMENVSDITDHEQSKKILRSFEGRVYNIPGLEKSHCRIM